MKDYSATIRLFFVSLLASLLLLTACSYLTNFAVVNASDRAIEVKYKIKNLTGSVSPHWGLPIVPAVKKISELHQEVSWQDLSASEFTIDPENRTVVVSLKPGEALRIEQRNLADESDPARNFSIEEINIKGTSGEITLQGERLYTSFVAESKKVYTLTYN